MNKPTLSLFTPFTETIRDIPPPDEVNISLKGHTPVIERKKKVLQGAMIAKCPAGDMGDIHAPVSGKVTGVTPSSISLKTDIGNLQTEPVDISGIDPGKELVRTFTFRPGVFCGSDFICCFKAFVCKRRPAHTGS